MLRYVILSQPVLYPTVVTLYSLSGLVGFFIFFIEGICNKLTSCQIDRFVSG
jgi:hypothetical protein